MIKFKEKNNNINKLIDLIYKILNDSYNEYTNNKETEKLKKHIQNKFNNNSNINNGPLLNKSLNDALMQYIRYTPY